MAWCLTKTAEANLLDALKKEGDPQKMVNRTSEERHAWFAKYVGEENAGQLNAFIESAVSELKAQGAELELKENKVGGSSIVVKLLPSPTAKK